VPASPTKRDLRESFYWTADGLSSFEGGYGPRLGKLGPVRATNVDFVRLAALVFAADRTVPRKGGGSNWSQRTFSLRVPVGDPLAWQSIRDQLSALLAFLTGDEWLLDFQRVRPPKETVRSRTSAFTPARIVLVSGGADSAVGALLSRAELPDKEGHLLLSHVGLKTLAPIQRGVVSAVERLLPGPLQEHVAIGLRRRAKQIDGSEFSNESSSRSRSLLFLSLGLAAASIHKVPLWIPENGFASLNPPLAPDRRGSLSTRTTHPRFLEGLSALLNQIGAQSQIHNPFADITKGEMFAKARKMLGADDAAELLGSTHSCAHSGQRAFGIGVNRQCGVCFGCVVRRASFKAAGLDDRSKYVVAGVNSKVRSWLDSKSVEPAMRRFVMRGVRPVDIAALSLPPSYTASNALDLSRRGCAELKAYLS
jgi:hypothetical protein